MVKSFLYRFIIVISLLLTNHSVSAEKNYPEIVELQKLYLEKNTNNKEKINQIIHHYRNDAEFKYQLGLLFFTIENYLDAEIQFKNLYTQSPKDKYEIAYAEALIFQKKFEEALYVINVASINDTYKAKKYLLRSKAMLGMDNAQKAYENILFAQQIVADDPEIILMHARTLTALEKIDESQELLDKLEKEIGKNIVIMLLRAENYTVKKDYLAAKSIYNDIISKFENVYDAHSGRGRVNLLMNMSAEALKDGLKMLQIDPSNPTGLYIVGSGLNQQGKYTEALKLYDGKGDNKTLFLPGLLLEAELNFNAGTYGRALVLLNKYLQVKPEDSKALKLRGILKLRHSTPREAIDDLEKANRLENSDAYILTALASAYYRAGRYEDAEAIYIHLYRNFPHLKTSAYDALQLSCNLPTVKRNKPKICGNQFATEMNGRIFEALDLMYIGQSDKGLVELKKLYQLYPNNLDVIKNYGRVLASSSQVDQSIDIFFKALGFDPNNQEILSELYSTYKYGKSTINIMNRLIDFFYNNNQSVDAGYYIVNFLYKGGQFAKAVEISKIMTKRRPADKQIYEMAIKVMVYDVKNFQKDIASYLKHYIQLNGKNSYLTRIIRQSILHSKVVPNNFDILMMPSGENSAKDFQVFAEYLNFIGKEKFAEQYYQIALRKFSSDFELFNSAFNFYELNRNVSDIENLVVSFNNSVPDFKIFFKARLAINNGEKQKAVTMLKEQFTQNYHGLIAKLLLQTDPSFENVGLVTDNFSYIKEYAKDVVVLLAEKHYEQKNFSKASSLLLPFYQQLEHNQDYLFMIAKASFYSDFSFAKQTMEKLLSKYPDNEKYNIENISFLARSADFGNAISLFEKYKPALDSYPSLHFYYALALGYDKQKAKSKQVLENIIRSKIKIPEQNEVKKLLEKKS